MDKTELIGKLHMIYAGDRNTLEEMVGYYDGLKELIIITQQENKRLKEKINEANEVLRCILVVKNEINCRPIKNTSRQDVYKTILLLNTILDTPYRWKYTEEEKNINEKELTYLDNKEKYWTKRVKELQQENKQLKERIEYLERSNNRREDEIISLRDELVETPKEAELKEKIDKAIEYIVTHTENIDRGRYYEDYVETYPILEILKGE